MAYVDCKILAMSPVIIFGNFHVDFKIAKCHLSNVRKGPCHVTNTFSYMSIISSMSHVDFKKWPCRPVKFKGQGPPQWMPPAVTRFTVDWVLCTFIIQVV